MKRTEFLKSLALIPIVGASMDLKEIKNISDNFGNSSRMPVLFIGHGNPMNAILDNPFTRTLATIGKSFQERPKAILVVSAHWLTRGSTHVVVSPKPEIIYDFGGFPDELYQVKYAASGSPELALETKKLVSSTSVLEDEEWGLDHGAWTVLKHMFPEADIPVFQLSIDYSRNGGYHFNLAQELKALRKKGVLIIGSGNIVHNLRKVDFSDLAEPFDWAIEFDETVKSKIENQQFIDLVNYQELGVAAMLSVPTPDHYWPMIYSLGLADKNEPIKFIYEEMQNASISMRCFQIG